jgi:flagellar biosynthesis/type III secretory pathway M-ring protein FliF/YscJ
MIIVYVGATLISLLFIFVCLFIILNKIIRERRLRAGNPEVAPAGAPG